MPTATEPFWLCHECHAEMHPLMLDDVPHCASCSSDFLEILDNAVNPPSPPRMGANLHYDVEVFEEHDPLANAEHDQIGHHHHHHHQHGQPISGHTAPGGILSTLLSGLLGANNAPDSQAGEARQGAGTNPGTRTMTFTLPGGGVGSFVIGRPQRLAPGEREDLGLESFLDGFGANAVPTQRRRSEHDGMTGQRAQQGPMDPNDLIEAMIGMFLDGRPPPGGFPGLVGPNIGNLGDYVLSQEGFDDVMEHLMNAAGPQGPIPASQIVIDGLPRLTMTKESIETSDYKDCPVCKDDFEPGNEVMRVPCSHIFHVGCLKPWLERNGSCPVCRFSLVPEGAQRPANTNPDTAQTPTAAATPGFGNFLSSLFSATLGGGRQSATVQQVEDPEPRPEEVESGVPDAPGAYPQTAPISTPISSQPSHSGDSTTPSTNTSTNSQYPSAIPQDYRDHHARRQAEEQAEEERLLRDLD